ncbi:MAG: hypothetical protein FWE51_04835, partial [Coriobacteriia bacterium]|nr:hypothetical protein [Coriobacteriia bacterium]
MSNEELNQNPQNPLDSTVDSAVDPARDANATESMPEAGKESLRTDANPEKKTLTRTPGVTMKELADTAAQREPVPVVRPATKLQLVSRRTQIKEASLASLFFICAFLAVLGVSLIFAFVAWRAFPIVHEIGLWNFLTGTKWSVAEGVFGAVPFIMG